MIAIIDYDAGNIKSVEKALHYLGEETTVTRDPQTLLNADKSNHGRAWEALDGRWRIFIHTDLYL